MAVFRLEAAEFERLEQVMKNFPDEAENVINEVLHNEGSQLIQESIRNLIPVSVRNWKGKKAPAKTGSSLTDVKGNLSITVQTTKNYQYLYFPDDGTNTRRHVGNKQFFFKGAEEQQSTIIDLCINRLTQP